MDRRTAHLAAPDVVSRLPLADRQRRVLSILGDDALDPALPSFRVVLADEVRRLFDRVVLPLALSSWPTLRDDGFLPKWRGGFELYGALGLSTMVTSRKRPPLVDLASRFLRACGASEGVVVAAGRAAIPVVFRALDRACCERVALGAAWILVLDEALDEGLAGRPVDEQKAIMRGVLHGLAPTWSPSSVQTAARFTRAVRGRCVGAADVAAFDALVVTATAWVDGELHGLSGDIDPDGTRWRQAGVTGSMDVLLWAVGAYAGDLERELLYAVAELGQIADDWLDLEKDRAQGRSTPATTGHWDGEAMVAVYARAEAALQQLADQAGEPEGGVFRRLLVRTFRGELQRMGRVLVNNP